jgi:hypothetical protein
VEAELRGSARPEEIEVIGAHYDTVPGSPGADDNASGVAAVLALARRFAHAPSGGTIRFLAFANEEPPWFWQAEMGSLVYAKECRARGDGIVAMLSLESVGFYSDAPRSQAYPAGLGLLYPAAGDFVAFIGNVSSRSLLRRAIAAFRVVLLAGRLSWHRSHRHCPLLPHARRHAGPSGLPAPGAVRGWHGEGHALLGPQVNRERLIYRRT